MGLVLFINVNRYLCIKFILRDYEQRKYFMKNIGNLFKFILIIDLKFIINELDF